MQKLAAPSAEQDDMVVVTAAKKALRKSMKVTLDSISREQVFAQCMRFGFQAKIAQKVLTKLVATPEYQKARRVAIYLSMDNGELQTRDIVRHALTNNKQVFVPRVHKVVNELDKKQEPMMDMLAMRSDEDPETMEKDKWGIPQLDSESLKERDNCFGGKGLTPELSKGIGLDLVVVPGVAFDRENGRLGHGKGYYDRFFSRCKQEVYAGKNASMPTLFALALEEQLLPEGQSVPTSDSDWQVDRVFTASETT